MPGEAGGLRRPLFLLALLAAVLVVLVEAGLATAVLGGPPSPPTTAAAEALGLDPGSLTTVADTGRPPGAGITFLAFFDGLLLFSLVLVGLPLVVPPRIHGRYQGLITLVVGILWIVGALLAALAAVVTLFTMIGLFLAFPFGTMAYLAIWGGFPTGTAATVLGLLLFLKLCLGVLLVLSQPRFLLSKGLMTLVALSFVLQLILGLIHGFLPGPVVSIGDQAWAIVTAIVAIVWALVMVIAAIPAIVKAVQSTTAVGD